MPSLVLWNLQKKLWHLCRTVLIKMKPALLTCHRFGRIWIYCWWYEVTNHISLSANVPAGPDKNWSPLPWRTPTPPTFIARFSELLLPTKNTLLAIDYEMLLHDKYEISWCVLFHSVNRNFKAKKQLNYRWKLLQSPKQVWAHCIAAQFIKK